MDRVAIFILGPSALPLAVRLRGETRGEIHAPEAWDGVDVVYGKATAAMGAAFALQQPIIGICAAAILIRAVAPFLNDKRNEPPVLSIDETGASVVPLLGGHHGANALARRLAAFLGATAAVTTASDVLFGESFDEPKEGFTLGSPGVMKAATAARLRGEHVEVVHTVKADAGSASRIIMHPHVLTVGIGCERGTEPAEVRGLIDEVFEKHGLSQDAIASFASIDVKEDEPAIAALRKVRFFSAEQLNVHRAEVPNPSSYVENTVGTPSVAEAAALAAAGEGATLLVPKTKSARATLAVAMAKGPITEPVGRARGHLAVVGIGPGERQERSPHATAQLVQATDWVGYDLYLDLVADLKSGQTEHRFPLGGEEARCRHAINLAAQGKHVALVCSGDAAIYAMAALVYELVDREPTRIAIEVVPGISAFQMASSRAGAMIGHDFCCISLSDLLTPWETIEKRLKAAAEGDFVVAFYNPRSLKRTDQIDHAFAILKPHRLADTPVVLASNLGRPQEQVRIIRFADFNASDVDMLTLVMVGSTQSRTITRGDGKTYAYTPRGYAKKMDVK